jgi:hypothetical protein
VLDISEADLRAFRVGREAGSALGALPAPIDIPPPPDAPPIPQQPPPATSPTPPPGGVTIPPGL